MKTKIKFLSGSVAMALAAGIVQATPVITVPSLIQLQPNTANQTIDLQVTGGDSVTGFNLRAELGNGSAAGAEPIFQSVTFGANTIWASHPSTVTGGPINGLAQDAQASVVFNTTGDSTSASGTVLTLTVSTVGFSSGTFPLMLASTEIGADSKFIGVTGGSEIPTTVSNGSIKVVNTPEPASFGLLALVGGLLGLRRRRTA